jgi:hypothetical protein
MSNFGFIASQFPEIAQEAMEAESLAQISPKSSAVLSRSALEKAVFWMYENDCIFRSKGATDSGAKGASGW